MSSGLLLKEHTMRDKNTKIDPRKEDPTNVGGDKNAGEENKVNKTEENKTKKYRENKNENMSKRRQGSQRLAHNFLIY